MVWTLNSLGTRKGGEALGSIRGAGNCGGRVALTLVNSLGTKDGRDALELQTICWKGWQESGVDVG